MAMSASSEGTFEPRTTSLVMWLRPLDRELYPIPRLRTRRSNRRNFRCHEILVLNSGSSSQKACLYEIENPVPVHPPAYLWKGRIEWHGDTAPAAVRSGSGIVQMKQVSVPPREQVMRELLSTSWHGAAQVIGLGSDIDAVVHRIVHGGPHFEDPAVITPDVRKAVAGVSAFSPLHFDAELEGVRIVENLWGVFRKSLFSILG